MQEHSDSLCGSHIGDKCRLIYESFTYLYYSVKGNYVVLLGVVAA